MCKKAHEFKEVKLENIPVELWEEIIKTKAEFAPELSIDEWVTILVKEGAKELKHL